MHVKSFCWLEYLIQKWPTFAWAQYISFWPTKTMISFFPDRSPKKFKIHILVILQSLALIFPNTGSIWHTLLLKNHKRILKWYRTCTFFSKMGSSSTEARSNQLICYYFSYIRQLDFEGCSRA